MKIEVDAERLERLVDFRSRIDNCDCGVNDTNIDCPYKKGLASKYYCYEALMLWVKGENENA